MSPSRWRKPRSGTRSDKMPPLLQKAEHRELVVACCYAIAALAAVIVGGAFGNVHGPGLAERLTAWLSTAAFVVLAVLATRRFANLFGRLVEVRTIRSAGATVRVATSIVGYLLVLFVSLGLLDVSITHLLVGTALTGIILGIAAQQSLGNVFSGLVLLLARPFDVGDHIRVRSGSLGGPFHGIVLGVSLTYVTFQVDGVPLKVPNAGLLAAAIGPYRPGTGEEPKQGVDAEGDTVLLGHEVDGPGDHGGEPQTEASG